MNEEQLVGFISLFKVYNISIEDDDLSEREKAYDNLRKNRITPLSPSAFSHSGIIPLPDPPETAC